MAGEYSCQLSVKVFAGQCRLIELGFRQGGPAASDFGGGSSTVPVRRKGNCHEGNRRAFKPTALCWCLDRSRKSRPYRWVYRAFVEEGRSSARSRTRLTLRGFVLDLGRPWTRGTVHQLLINEKYAGDNVENRVSCKLHGDRVHNGRDMWVRREGAFEAVVDRLVFDAARVIILERSRRLTDDEMIEAFRAPFSLARVICPA